MDNNTIKNINLLIKKCCEFEKFGNLYKKMKKGITPTNYQKFKSLITFNEESKHSKEWQQLHINIVGEDVTLSVKHKTTVYMLRIKNLDINSLIDHDHLIIDEEVDKNYFAVFEAVDKYDNSIKITYEVDIAKVKNKIHLILKDWVEENNLWQCSVTTMPLTKDETESLLLDVNEITF